MNYLKKRITLFFIIPLLSGLHAQPINIPIIGKVESQITRDPLIGVNIYLIDSPLSGTTTDENGTFKLVVNELPAVIRFSFIGFYDQTILLKEPPSDSLFISLRTLISELPEVFVSSQVVIDTVFNAPRSVTDYEFYSNFIFLLAYKNTFEKYSLIVLDEENNELIDHSLKDLRPVSLFKSCLDKVYLICEKFVYELRTNGINLQFKNKTSTHSFEEIVKPCVSASDNFMYFSKFYFQGQALQYKVVPKTKMGSPKKLPIIQNEDNINLLIEETGLRFPRSGDIWQKEVSENFQVIRTMDYQLNGMMKIFYPVLNAPLVSTDSFLYIFNHPDNQLQLIKESGQQVYHIPITYHQTGKWKKEILFDQKTEKVYTCFNTKTGENIHQIHVEDGTLGPGIPINRVFIKNKKVHDGYLYFLYKNPYTAERNLKLHRTRL